MPAFLIHQQSNNILHIENVVIIANEWVSVLGNAKGVTAIHARISELDSGYCIETHDGNTMINGLPATGKLELQHNDVLLFGDKKKGAYFIFKNEAQKQKQLDTRKIKMLAFQQNKSVAEQMIKDFFHSTPTSSLSEFAKYLLDFLQAKFRIHRGVIYRVAGKKWLPILARATATNFIPPKAILTRVWEGKKPERFSLGDIEDTKDLSRSIVNNRVFSAICFPVLYNAELVAVVYMDTQDEKVKLSSDDLMVLCTLMPAIGGLMRVLIDYDLSRTEAWNLISSWSFVDSCPRVDVKIYNGGFECGLACFKSVNNCDFGILIKLSSGKKMSLNEQIAHYVKFITALRYIKLSEETASEQIMQLMNSLWENFPEIKVNIGILSISDKGYIRFFGNGEIFLVVSENKTYCMDLRQVAIPYGAILEKDVSDDASFLMTSNVHIEQYCTKPLTELEAQIGSGLFISRRKKV